MTAAGAVLFVGAGRIGAPIASRLIASGLDLHIADADPAVRAAFAARGVRVLDPAQITPLAYGRAVLCLPDGEAAGTLIGSWAAHALPPEATVADLTTIAPSRARQFAELLARSGADYLDAPVTGGQSGAESGDLVVMASGREAAFARMRPLLERIGRTVRYLGPAGNASLLKAINQFVYLSYNIAFAHGLQLGHELGLPDDVVREVLSKGAAGHPLINDRLPAAMRSRFREGFILRRSLKDLDCLEAPPGLDSAALDAYRSLRREIHQAVERGLGELDILALSQPRGREGT